METPDISLSGKIKTSNGLWSIKVDNLTEKDLIQIVELLKKLGNIKSGYTIDEAGKKENIQK